MANVDLRVRTLQQLLPLLGLDRGLLVDALQPGVRVGVGRRKIDGAAGRFLPSFSGFLISVRMRMVVVVVMLVLAGSEETCAGHNKPAGEKTQDLKLNIKF